MNTTKRFSIALLLALSALGTPGLALAETPASPTCTGHSGHEGRHRGARFKHADKNHDGFLTKDEVGEKRWQRFQIADANQDGKVSRPELREARRAGKLPHPDKTPKG